MSQKSAAGAAGRAIRACRLPAGVLARITTGDLVDEFQASLDAYLEADPILGGHHDDTD